MIQQGMAHETPEASVMAPYRNRMRLLYIRGFRTEKPIDFVPRVKGNVNKKN